MIIYEWSLLKHGHMVKARIGKGFLQIYVYNPVTTLDNLKKLVPPESCRYVSR